MAVLRLFCNQAGGGSSPPRFTITNKLSRYYGKLGPAWALLLCRLSGPPDSFASSRQLFNHKKSGGRQESALDQSTQRGRIHA